MGKCAISWKNDGYGGLTTHIEKSVELHTSARPEDLQEKGISALVKENKQIKQKIRKLK